MNGLLFVGYVLSTEFYCWAGGILLFILLVVGAKVIGVRMMDERMESEVQAIEGIEKEEGTDQDKQDAPA